MIIAIDGPAGSGKSTTARAVAERLGYLHLDSGSLYRAFAWAAQRRDWADEQGELDAERVPELSRVSIDVRPTPVGLAIRVDGQPVRAELRSPEVTRTASRVSRFSEIRQRVNGLLRRVGSEYGRGIVCEGRDIGTVVYPEAELKIWLTASIETRARRRLQQQGQTPDSTSIEAEARRLSARDEDDAKREVAPLVRAPDAVEMDTTDLTPEEQVETIVQMARERVDTT